MQEYHIYQAIKNHADNSPVRFHMPGHKGRKGKFALSWLEDLTELSIIDNEQALLRAEDDLASILGAGGVKIMSDGASMGIFSVVYAAKKLTNKSKLIINRSSHKSVYNALKILNVEPIIIANSERDGLANLPTVEEAVKSLDDNPDCIGVALTYPDYYGQTFDIKGISKAVKERGKLLIIDNAHGGHYKFINNITYAGEYADFWVDGVHKTFRTLNQGAIACCKAKSSYPFLSEGVSIFSTTSPSYPILASVECGIKEASQERKEFSSFTKKINQLKNQLSKVGFDLLKNKDPFKLVIDCYDEAVKVETELECDNIFIEMNDGRRLVCMFSLQTTDKELKKLYETLIKCVPLKSKKTEETHIYSKGVIPYLQAINGENKAIDLKDAVGKIAGENAGLFPPCYPLVVAGEEITQEVVQKLLENENAFGVCQGKIKIVRS